MQFAPPARTSCSTGKAMNDDSAPKRVEGGPMSPDRSIPRWLRNRIDLGTQRADRLRAAIATDARVPTMPLVEIVDEVWIAEDELILSCTGLIEHPGGGDLCALLSAPCAIQTDDELLRAVLAREFHHCFQLWIRLVRTRQGRMLAAPDCGEQHHTAQPDPLRWLGAEDERRVTNWPGDRPIDGMRILAAFTAKFLPTAKPPRFPQARDVRPPDWIADYAYRQGDRALTRERGASNE